VQVVPAGPDDDRDREDRVAWGEFADEVFELVTSGAAVTLLAEGNAIIYSRPRITCVPVTGLDPARLAIAWRHDDRRTAVRDFIHACRDAAGTSTRR